MTTPRPSVSNITVSGGAGGTEAQYEDLAAMGRLTDDVAEQTLGIAITSHRYLADPDLVASALLDPEGAARFEAALLDALDGPNGLTAVSAEIGLRGIALRASAETYRLTDELNAKALDSARWLDGAIIASNPVTMTAAAVGISATIAVEVYGHDGGNWERYLVEHPGMVDNLIGMSPGELSVLGLPSNLASLTKLIASAYPHGQPHVKDIGLDQELSRPGGFDPRIPPHGLGSIVDGLGHRNDAPDSNIDVRKVIGADGKVAYIVDIPGTKVWNLPGGDNGSVNDTGTNLDAMAGNTTVLQMGIAEALHGAGVAPNDPVMLVGHSQGGMVAARAAHDFVSSGEYNVTHVITAGSPVGRMPIPDGVQMLSLENNNDIVPHLDASENPDAANHTTVKFDDQRGTVGGNHQIGGNYAAAAHQLDASTDPSVQRFRNSLGAFTDGTSVQTLRYEVTRS